MKNFFLFFFAVAVISCENSQTKSITKPDLGHSKPSKERSYKIIFTENVGWGYQIFEGSKMMIDQKHIPAVQGNIGFETREKSEIAAKYVMQKIENGIFPPTISPAELDSIGVYTDTTLTVQ